MNKIFIQYILILLSTLLVHSIKDNLNCKNENIYSQYGVIVNNEKEASINIEIQKPEKSQFSVEMVVVICNILDFQLIGYVEDDMKYLTCSEELIAKKICEKEGEVILNEEKTPVSNIYSKTFKINETSDYPYEIEQYKVENTGYYSVILKSNSIEYDNEPFDIKSVVNWHSSTGELAGGDYPKIKFYGILSMVYICICIVWIINAYIYRQDILPIQHYLTGITVFLVTEMIMNYIYWKYFNSTGNNSIILLIFAGALNAGRNSLSFFILLIVCMGYGVVKQSLGSTMRKVQTLTVFHFMFGVVYAIGLMVVSEITEIVVLLFVLPLSATMTIFYIWTLAALTNTIKKLGQRRQEAKLNMFLNLRKILVICIVVLCIFFIISSLNFTGSQNIEWVASHWQTRWFWIDGFLNILYLFGFSVVLFLWRPTSNNQRYGLDQLPMDDVDEIDLESNFVNPTSNDIKSTQKNPGQIDDIITEGFDFGSESEDGETGPETNDELYKWAEENIEVQAVGDETNESNTENILENEEIQKDKENN